MLPINILKKELLELAELQINIEKNGGFKKNGSLFEDYLKRCASILKSFGLPAIDKYNKLLSLKKMPTDAMLDEIIMKLVRTAEEFLLSPAKTETQILEDAVLTCDN